MSQKPVTIFFIHPNILSIVAAIVAIACITQIYGWVNGSLSKIKVRSAREREGRNIEEHYQTIKRRTIALLSKLRTYDT